MPDYLRDLYSLRDLRPVTWFTDGERHAHSWLDAVAGRWLPGGQCDECSPTIEVHFTQPQFSCRITGVNPEAKTITVESEDAS